MNTSDAIKQSNMVPFVACGDGVVLLTIEETKLLCAAMLRRADRLISDAARWREKDAEYKQNGISRLTWIKMAIRYEREARKLYDRYRELKAICLKMQNDKGLK